MLVINRAEVERLLDLDQLVDSVSAALSELSVGNAALPIRATASASRPKSLLIAMPTYLHACEALLTKVVSLFPENRDRPTHQAVICVFDPDNGTPVALMDGTYITAARTAAGSALATRLLCATMTKTVSIIGTGVQAEAHVRAMIRILPEARVMVAGRSAGKARWLAERLSSDLRVPIEAAASVEEAVRLADVVCAVTHADRPVIRREWLNAGAHVNSVGHNSAGQGEVDTGTIRDALVVVESRTAALAPIPSGAVDLLQAVALGALTAERIIELGDLASGRATGRTDQQGLTLYRSVGVAVEDAAAAMLVLKSARQEGVGTEIAV